MPARWSTPRRLVRMGDGGLWDFRSPWLRVVFRPTVTGTCNVLAGFWAPNQDAWIRVDDVRVDGPCADVALNPVDG